MTGEYLLSHLQSLEQEFPGLVTNARGRGLMCAIDLDTALNRDHLRTKAYEEGLILIGCGDHSIRFRPPLNLSKTEVDEGLQVIRTALREITKGE